MFSISYKLTYWFDSPISVDVLFQYYSDVVGETQKRHHGNKNGENGLTWSSANKQQLRLGC
jgi:hypothetical protein